jgi:hypothetical protein
MGGEEPSAAGMIRPPTSGSMSEPAGPPDQRDSTAGSNGTSSRFTELPMFASVVASLLLVIYLVFVAMQWGNVQADDLIYARRAALLKGLEALAFAAAGAVLGTTVQRQVTKKAEAQATEARQEAENQKTLAEANQADAEKGRALHNMAKAKAAVRPAPVRTRAESTSAASDLEDFLNLAAQYDASRRSDQ